MKIIKEDIVSPYVSLIGRDFKRYFFSKENDRTFNIINIIYDKVSNNFILSYKQNKIDDAKLFELNLRKEHLDRLKDKGSCTVYVGMVFTFIFIITYELI